MFVPIKSAKELIMTKPLIITDHVKQRYVQRVSKKGCTISGIKDIFRNGRRLQRLPLNKYNMRFFTRYPECSFIKFHETVLVTKEDIEGIIAVTILKWNGDMKECLF